MKLVTAEVMKELDRVTIERHKLPGLALMERAGSGAFRLLMKYFPREIDMGLAVICGGGNNGGDGFVLARYANDNGIRTRVFLLVSPDSLRGDALENYKKIDNKMPVEVLPPNAKSSAILKKLPGFGCIVDAIFGTGFRGRVDGIYRETIKAINSSGKRVLAIDIPSGLNPDSGEEMGISVRADMTVTFGLPKLGQVIYPGVNFVGRLEVVDIGIPDEVVQEQKILSEVLMRPDLKGIIKPRRGDSHKGDYGHLLVIAGSPGKTGAAVLAANAALRAGAGLVTLAVPGSLGTIFEVKTTEAMTVALHDKDKGFFVEDSVKGVLDAIKGKDAIALGPGIGTDAETQRFVEIVLGKVNLPLVIDADGLNCISRNLSVLKKTKARLVLTPHPGEMARLSRKGMGDIQKDRIGAAKKFAKEYGCVTVLKGARTVIAAPDGRFTINASGNPGMATGGMGDVLTGIIGSLLAQGYSDYDSARYGALLHGLAGDALAERYGPFGYMATEVSDELPRIFRGIAEALD